MSSEPDLSQSFTVGVDGMSVPPVDGMGNTIWTYDSSENMVLFADGSQPGPGASVTITYHPKCF